jgi:membrane fusion protein, multidrug efflux system
MVSRSQFDNAENLYRAGEAKLQQLKAEQDVASNQASYAVLRAPQDGVIAQRQVEVGQVVSVPVKPCSRWPPTESVTC